MWQNRNVTIACIAFFLAFILFTIFQTNFQSINDAVNSWTTTIHADTAILLAKALSVAFDTITLAIISIVVASFLFIKNHKDQSLLLLAAVGGNALFVAIIKTLTHVARPENQLLYSSGFSYPSGHVTGVIIFVGLITYYAWLNWSDRKQVKLLSLVGFGLVVAFVSFDRLYLNVHWFSDVVGGCLFGAFWLSFCVMVYERFKRGGAFKSKIDLVVNLFT